MTSALANLVLVFIACAGRTNADLSATANGAATCAKGSQGADGCTQGIALLQTKFRTVEDGMATEDQEHAAAARSRLGHLRTQPESLKERHQNILGLEAKGKTKEEVHAMLLQVAEEARKVEEDITDVLENDLGEKDTEDEDAESEAVDEEHDEEDEEDEDQDGDEEQDEEDEQHEDEEEDEEPEDEEDENEAADEDEEDEDESSLMDTTQGEEDEAEDVTGELSGDHEEDDEGRDEVEDEGEEDAVHSVGDPTNADDAETQGEESEDE